MQNTIKEELQQLLPANLVDAQVSDAELESVAGGVRQYSTGGRTVILTFQGVSTVPLSIGNTSGRVIAREVRTILGVTVDSI
ncbi:hypothetical protein [Iningainema tapete]|uniref:Uncharacterized protein n=1 Tax=Iningainema tapete BLCC-T55 TaxID=2748662 RepID=A0A8J6XJL9_9CYAN|nr:hypothetical protein [Iningainema tapete]MBD2774057.1 hypothetical protein [Iningainema tapete BLCC-T55]